MSNVKAHVTHLSKTVHENSTQINENMYKINREINQTQICVQGWICCLEMVNPDWLARVVCCFCHSKLYKQCETFPPTENSPPVTSLNKGKDVLPQPALERRVWLRAAVRTPLQKGRCACRAPGRVQPQNPRRQFPPNAAASSTIAHVFLHRI